MRNTDPFSDLIRSIEENLQRQQEGDDWVPPDDGEGRRSGGPPQEGGSRRIIWFLLPILLFIFFNRFLGFFTDYIWYDSLGLTSVFTTRLYASLGLFAAAASIFWIFLALNVLLARRLEPFGLNGTPVEQIAAAFGVRVTPVVLVVGAIFAFFMGLTASAMWEDVLVFLNQSSFGVNDPVFNLDSSFFLFTLPIWQAARTWLMTTLVITLLATALVSGVGWRGWDMRTSVLVHLSVLGALILLLIAWQYQLDAYQLVFSNRGAVFGAGYTDVNAQLPAYNILSIITLITAVLLVVTAFLRRAWRAVAVVLVLWVAVAFLAGNVYPGLVQRFQVSPNELTLETPFIEDNIEFTRLAYDLHEIEVQAYDATRRLTADSLVAEPEIVRNIRLWDYRPLLQTYNQVQALRQYYEFNDIDIDRYTIDGEPRQVMLSARELVPDRLNETAQTWVNRRLVYTHGYGVAASPVAQITPDGLPEFLLKDLPTTGIIEITQPEIYFGERTNDYVIARSNQPEFSYPRGDGNVTTSFSGETGIDMTFMNRLLFALRFADVNILLNSDISAESQLLWRRNIVERIQEVAPFLRYDSDPYIVVGDDGALYWMLDAYTISNRFPYSEPYGQINYIRNPVKVVTSAYDGAMTFYVVDPNEPILAAYNRIFPVLFTPIEEMPEFLKDNIRYPNDLFSVQAEVFRTYHMRDVVEFYNKEDVWAWPEEIFDNQPRLMEPYYVLMVLPGTDQLRFIQILPFTPANRENMISWLAAVSDPDDYGRKVVYEFGKDTLFFGPKQVEARIDQDPIISAQLSLWNQQGSNVIRGNLLVIPVGGSLIYVEPLYLQAANGKIPELKRVILATADRVVMAENLGLSLAQLFGEEVLVEAGLDDLMAGITSEGAVVSEIGPEDTLAGATLEQLVVQANEHYVQAQEYLQTSDWANYGAEMIALQAVLEQMVEVSGVQLAPVPAEPADEGADQDVDASAQEESAPADSEAVTTP